MARTQGVSRATPFKHGLKDGKKERAPQPTQWKKGRPFLSKPSRAVLGFRQKRHAVSVSSMVFLIARAEHLAARSGLLVTGLRDGPAHVADLEHDVRLVAQLFGPADVALLVDLRSREQNGKRREREHKMPEVSRLEHRSLNGIDPNGSDFVFAHDAPDLVDGRSRADEEVFALDPDTGHPECKRRPARLLDRDEHDRRLDRVQSPRYERGLAG